MLLHCYDAFGIITTDNLLFVFVYCVAGELFSVHVQGKPVPPRAQNRGNKVDDKMAVSWHVFQFQEIGWMLTPYQQ